MLLDRVTKDRRPTPAVFRFRIRRFCCVGRRVGGVLVALAGLTLPSPVTAQLPDSLWISTSGTSRPGADTYVLLSGVLGGVSGYRGIERRLLALGHRVIIIDPYLMSIDSADVTFDALARRVNAQLDARHVMAARVVGHAHGGGVALRLAANYPTRVVQLFLLNVGALAGNHSPVFSSSTRLASIVTHLPGGKRFVRGRIVAGIRENTVNSDWLDDAAAHAYTDVPLANIAGVLQMVTRLGDSQEPDSISVVVARIRIPVTLLLGAETCPASPGPAELEALQPLGTLVRTVRIKGTCHFPHEEAPEVVMAYLTQRR
jgi:pimeloyl-ACP methyl ester carboxylesterase